MKKYPLRKIVRLENVSFKDPDTGLIIEIAKERLECGHLIGVKQDIYGKTNAYRRRCYKCKKRNPGAGPLPK